MEAQYDSIKTTASVAWQATDADTIRLVYLVTGRHVAVADGEPGRSVRFVLEGVSYEATYHVAGEWWDRGRGSAWGTRMACIEHVHVARLGTDGPT